MGLIGCDGWLAVSEGHKICPFLFSPQCLSLEEDQNIKKSETSSSRGIGIDTTLSVIWITFEGE